MTLDSGRLTTFDSGTLTAGTLSEQLGFYRTADLLDTHDIVFRCEWLRTPGAVSHQRQRVTLGLE